MLGTFACMGVAKPSTNVLEVTNSQGDTLKKWKDESKQATDPQVAYIINDILGDADTAVLVVGNPTSSHLRLASEMCLEPAASSIPICGIEPASARRLRGPDRRRPERVTPAGLAVQHGLTDVRGVGRHPERRAP